jgi:hypothetical protein
MASIVGVYNSQDEAKGALSDLLSRGFKFDNENVSVVVSDKEHDVRFSPTSDEKMVNLVKGSAKGAMLGGSLAALFASIMGIGTITIKGMGLLAAGPAVASVAGAGLGIIVGGLCGALITAVYEVKRSRDSANKGKAVVIVHTKDEIATRAARQALHKNDVSLKVAY